MPSKKKRRNKFDEMFGSSALDNADFFKGSATGYSISVVQTDQGTKVRAKVGKDTNVEDMRKQLKQKYPNAEIGIKGSEKKPLIREISTKRLKQDTETKPNNGNPA